LGLINNRLEINLKHPYLLLVITSVLVLGSCGKDENSSASANKTDAGTASDSNQSSAGANQVAATAQDINPQERSALKPGDLTLKVTNFAEMG